MLQLLSMQIIQDQSCYADLGDAMILNASLPHSNSVKTCILEISSTSVILINKL